LILRTVSVSYFVHASPRCAVFCVVLMTGSAHHQRGLCRHHRRKVDWEIMWLSTLFKHFERRKLPNHFYILKWSIVYLHQYSNIIWEEPAQEKPLSTAKHACWLLACWRRRCSDPWSPAWKLNNLRVNVTWCLWLMMKMNIKFLKPNLTMLKRELHHLRLSFANFPWMHVHGCVCLCIF